MKLGPQPFARALAAFAFFASVLHAASFPPELHFKAVETRRVVVYFHEGLEPMARQAASLATEILEAHEARYHVFVGKLHIVLSDVEDDPNGFTTPFPYPLVSIRAVAPDGSAPFGNYESWLRLVLTHELAHSVHTEEAHGLVSVARKIFGRAPFLFPNILTPTWMVEGLATYEETSGTAFGRGRNPDVQMVVRMAALEGGFPGEDQAVAPYDKWPGGDTAYFFGVQFLEYLSERFGERVLPDLARTHSGRLFPYLDELTAERVTGESFAALWKEWRALEMVSALHVAERVREKGLTLATSLTERGIAQISPRFSPDGAWIAYTSRTLTRYPAIRLVRRDGSGDHILTLRNGGAALAWTPDGTSIVYDEPDVYRLFALRFDLKEVDVGTGKVRQLTHGLRARDPDVAPDGKTVVFVRLSSDGSELALLDRKTHATRDLTRSLPGTRWSEPHWSPSAGMVVAARFLPGGNLNIVTVDAETGDVVERTHDRSRNMEPVFSRDGSTVIFRSDREGISNLYALTLSDGRLAALTNVIGGAFSPEVSPDGNEIAYTNYTAKGYDVALMPLDLGGVSTPDPFVDSFPAPRQDPEPVVSPTRPYRPLPFLLPRYWTPYASSVNGEWRYGLLTGASDPLGQHSYGIELARGTSTGKEDLLAYYQYDRFWPTFFVSYQDTNDPEAGGVILHSREFDSTLALPVQRSYRLAQTVSLSFRRRRETLENVPRPEQLDLGGVEVGYDLGSAKLYPYSISPSDGWLVHAGYLKEDPAFGGVVSLGKLTFDGRGYLRLGETQVLAVRAGGGATLGSPRFVESFAVGGFPEGTLSDVIDTNFTVLRGYPDDAFRGRSFVHLNLEYRFPLVYPEHGYRSSPVFLRHLHGALFADAANAWVGPFRTADLKPALGGALGFDGALSQGYGITGTVGVARGLSTLGETRFYARLGLAF